MEWNSSTLSNSLKDHRTTRVPFNNNNNGSNNKLKDSWNYNGGDQDYLSGFSWPPRSYTCSFCKREFRSAQALGGHMNVHRRDRARLRQSPPPPPSRDGQCNNNNNNTLLNLNLNPNPNPSFPPPPPFISCSTKPTALVSSSSTLSTLPSSSSSSVLCTPSEIKKWGVVDRNINGSSFARMGTQKSFLCVKEFGGLKKDRCKFLKKGENINVRLDLEIGHFSNYSNPKEELDLELRLGYS